LLTPSDRYNPSNLSFMEEYLQTQVATGEYDLLGNLAILKLCVCLAS
jgi:translation initiation factor 3 subunit K